MQEGLLKSECSRCHLEQWQGSLIPLELHHLNGINNDHRIENIVLLCPNCHSLTSTFRGKNVAMSRKRSHHLIPLKEDTRTCKERTDSRILFHKRLSEIEK